MGIEARAAKADLYTDMRSITTGEPIATMATWDQDYLEKVIEEKNSKRGPASSEIVCKFFLDAVENRTYGWFWDCPNGAQCQYKHCLPPGFVLKRDKEKNRDLEKLEERRIEEIIDTEREGIVKLSKLTPVTLDTFNAWKKRKQEEKEKKLADEIKKESRKSGARAFHMLTGRALFKYDPT